MAQTLANGVVIPAPGDRISAAGVQEMRTLGASVSSGLALTQAHTTQVDLQSRARDSALEDLIAGMEGMTYVGAWESGRTYRINDVVAHGGDSWARLTAGTDGEPGASSEHWGLVARKGDGGGFGELTETDEPGLYDTVDGGIEARLAVLEYDSGLRSLTGIFGLTSGEARLRIRSGWAWMGFDNATVYGTGTVPLASDALSTIGPEHPVRIVSGTLGNDNGETRIVEVTRFGETGSSRFVVMGSVASLA